MAALVYALPRADAVVPLAAAAPLTGALSLVAALADTVSALKRQVHGLSGLHPSVFALQHAGRILPAHASLHALGVRPAAALDIVSHFIPAAPLRSRTAAALLVEPRAAAGPPAAVALQPDCDAVTAHRQPLLVWALDNADYAHHVLCPASRRLAAPAAPACLCADCDALAACACANPHACADDGAHDHYEFAALAASSIPSYAAAPAPGPPCTDHQFCSFASEAPRGPEPDAPHTHVAAAPSPVPCPLCVGYLAPHLAATPPVPAAALSRRSCFLVDCDSGEVVPSTMLTLSWAATAPEQAPAALAPLLAAMQGQGQGQDALELAATLRAALLAASDSGFASRYIDDRLNTDVAALPPPRRAAALAEAQPSPQHLEAVARGEPAPVKYPPPPLLLTAVVPNAPLAPHATYALCCNFTRYPAFRSAQRWRAIEAGNPALAPLLPLIREYEDDIAAVVLPGLPAQQPVPHAAPATSAAVAARRRRASLPGVPRTGRLARLSGGAAPPLQQFPDELLFRFHVL
jgi:hypothetical protein